MTIEEEFFKAFGIGTPVVKCVEWDNDMFAHYDDWQYVQRTFNELRINISVEELNKCIKEYKEKDAKNIKHDGYCFSNGCFVKAFYQYPEITAEKLLQLICVVVSQQTSYVINEKDKKTLTKNVLHRAIELKDYIYKDVQELFE